MRRLKHMLAFVFAGISAAWVVIQAYQSLKQPAEHIVAQVWVGPSLESATEFEQRDKWHRFLSQELPVPLASPPPVAVRLHLSPQETTVAERVIVDLRERYRDIFGLGALAPQGLDSGGYMRIVTSNVGTRAATNVALTVPIGSAYFVLRDDGPSSAPVLRDSTFSSFTVQLGTIRPTGTTTVFVWTPAEAWGFADDIVVSDDAGIGTVTVNHPTSGLGYRIGSDITFALDHPWFLMVLILMSALLVLDIWSSNRRRPLLEGKADRAASNR